MLRVDTKKSQGVKLLSQLDFAGHTLPSSAQAAPRQDPPISAVSHPKHGVNVSHLQWRTVWRTLDLAAEL